MLKTQWKEKARCAGADTAIFIPPVGVYVTEEYKARALEYCLACPVRRECVNYAFENKIQHGIYGGMTNKERRKNLYKWKRGEL
jgi:WhiB family redox-sensing transcriptional regulator